MSDVNLIKPAKAMLHSTAAAFNQELRNCQKLKLIIKADLSAENPEHALTQEQKDALRGLSRAINWHLRAIKNYRITVGPVPVRYNFSSNPAGEALPLGSLAIETLVVLLLITAVCVLPLVWWLMEVRQREYEASPGTDVTQWMDGKPASAKYTSAYSNRDGTYYAFAVVTYGDGSADNCMFVFKTNLDLAGIPDVKPLSRECTPVKAVDPV